MEAGFNEGPYTVNAVLVVVRCNVRDVSYEKGQALAAFHKGVGIVGQQIPIPGGAGRGSEGSHGQRLDFALPPDQDPPTSGHVARGYFRRRVAATQLRVRRGHPLGPDATVLLSLLQFAI